MLVDQAARDVISTESDRLLFVEAGAGTGKTTALVDRIVSMVTGAGSFEPVPMSAIAAITFTEKAAAELRNRVRTELNKALLTAAPAHRSLVIDALAELDGAAVGTLHSFARRILAEHPVEAGLPPAFETLDEIASEVAFDERWEIFLSDLMSDESMRWPIGMLDAVGVTPDHLRDLARALNDNSDRLEWPAQLSQLGAFDTSRIQLLAAELLEHRGECKAPDACALYAAFEPISVLRERLKSARNDRERLRALVITKLPNVRTKGRRDNWPDISAIRDAFSELADEVAGAVAEVVSETLGRLTERIRAFTLDTAAQRLRAGGLEFHDLLVQARWLLRDSPTAPQVRATLANQYQRLLLDEFQDTDPIQIDLASLIAFPDGVDAPSAAPERLFFVGDPKQSIYRFRRADIAVYMDAQQRLGNELGSVVSMTTNFRTLPTVIDWFNEVFAQLIIDVDAEQPPYAPLTAGRRPAAPAAGTRERPDDEGVEPRPDPIREPRVTVLGMPAHAHAARIDGIREAESVEIAGAITAILDDGWTVSDPRSGVERPARPSDIAILIPKRTGLPQLEDALSDADISYRLEAASFVWRTAMVRDLLMCLRAVADPTDALAVASALRSPIYGCGDDDLYRHRIAHHGSWNYTDPRLDDAPPTPVTDALAHLRTVHQRRTVLGPAALIDALVRERRVYEQVATRWRPRDSWRQIRYLVDQARAWSDSQHGGLRGFLTWARGQASENARITESILPESDDEAVRVMTIHAAKGLEFPIVVVAGLQDKPRKRSGVQVIFNDASTPPEIRLRDAAQSADFSERNEAEIVAGHYERLRLLYVACTRARDHLIVSVHRKAAAQKTQGDHNLESGVLLAFALYSLDESSPDEPPGSRTWRSAEFGPSTAESETGEVVGESDAPVAASEAPAPERVESEQAGSLPPPRSRAEWRVRLASAVAASRLPSHLSASALAKRSGRHLRDIAGAEVQPQVKTQLEAGLSKDDGLADGISASVDNEGVDGSDDRGGSRVRRGRYGTAFGSAVHAVLQNIDIADAQSRDRVVLTSLARICAEEHGVADRWRDVVRMVKSALDSDTVTAAARGRHWQEIFVTAPLESGLVLEGFIDLLYETPDGGLVVVDFKTDVIGDGVTVDDKTSYYRLQGATYAWCVQQATGKRVDRIVFLYLSREGTTKGVVEGSNLVRALAEVEPTAQSARGGGW